MKVDKTKLEIATARVCMSMEEFAKAAGKAAGVSCPIITRIKNGSRTTTATVGRIARALGCDVLDILESERQDGTI